MNGHYVKRQGDWLIAGNGELVACWASRIVGKFTGGNDHVRMQRVYFPVEFSEPPCVQVTKVESSNDATELSCRIEVNAVQAGYAEVKCNAYSWSVPNQREIGFSLFVIGTAASA